MPTSQYGEFSRVHGGFHGSSTPGCRIEHHKPSFFAAGWGRRSGFACNLPPLALFGIGVVGPILLLSAPSRVSLPDHTFSPRLHNTRLDLTVFYHTTLRLHLLPDYSYRVARSKYVLTAPDFLDALFALVPAPVRPPVAACCVAAQSKRAQRPENPGLFDSRSRRLWRCLPMHIFNHPTNAPESQHLTFINHCLPETRDPKLGSGHEAARILTREPKVCAVVEPEAQGTWHPKA